MLAWLGARGAAGLAAANFDPLKRLRNSVYLSGVVIGVLVLYAAIRVVTSVIPITAVRQALVAPLDRLLTGWSGDMHVLLNDPAQSANIRASVDQATRALTGAGFDRVAMVAHSGGAVAGYMTLTDATLWQPPATAAADKATTPTVVSIVTLGQGLNIAWRLCDVGDGGNCDDAEGSCTRLVVPLRTLHPGLRWHDFWSDGDQVSDSELSPPACLVGDVNDQHSIENKPSNAHGSYWDNDEEFLLPVVDRLENAARTPAAGQPAGSFPVPNPDWVAERHLRVGMYSFTRRMLFSSMALAILGAGVLGGAAVDDLGRGVISIVSQLPGHEIVTVPTGALHRVAAGDWFSQRHFVGQFGLSLLLVLLTIYGLVRLGPRKLAWEYGPWSPLLRGMIRAVDVAVAFVPVLPLAVWFRTAGEGEERLDAPFWPLVIALALVATGLVVLLLRFRGDDRATSVVRSVVRTSRSGLGAIGLLLIASVLVTATVLEVAGNHAFGAGGAPLGEVAIGTVAIWVLFGLLGRVANWRWNAWDDREREQFRQARGVGQPPALQVTPGRWGRRVDVLVIFLVSTAALALAAALGAPLLSDDTRFSLAYAVGGIVIGIWLIGSGQDAANSRAGIRPAEIAPLPSAS